MLVCFWFHKHTNYLQRRDVHQHLASGARGDFISLLGLKISLASVSNLTPGTLKMDTADGEREKVRETGGKRRFKDCILSFHLESALKRLPVLTVTKRDLTLILSVTGPD